MRATVASLEVEIDSLRKSAAARNEDIESSSTTASTTAARPAAVRSNAEEGWQTIRLSRPPASKPPSTAPRQSIIFRWLRNYFTGGNSLVRAGVVILFFGVAFLLRY